MTPCRCDQQLLGEIGDDAEEAERHRHIAAYRELVEGKTKGRNAELSVDEPFEQERELLEHQRPGDQLEPFELRHGKLFGGLRLDASPVGGTLADRDGRRCKERTERR